MTSFRFDIRQCLSFPTYEIWSLVTTGVRNLFTMFFSIQKRSFCKGSSESIEENHMHLTTTWRLVIFNKYLIQVYIQECIHTSSAKAHISQKYSSLSQARIDKCTHITFRCGFIFSASARKSWNKSGFCCAPTVQPHLSGPDEVELAERQSQKATSTWLPYTRVLISVIRKRTRKIKKSHICKFKYIQII